jgi:hypothetical protein
MYSLLPFSYRASYYSTDLAFPFRTLGRVLLFDLYGVTNHLDVVRAEVDRMRGVLDEEGLLDQLERSCRVVYG